MKASGRLQVDDVDLPARSGGASPKAVGLSDNRQISWHDEPRLAPGTLDHALKVLAVALAAAVAGKSHKFLLDPMPRLSPGAGMDLPSLPEGTAV